MKIQSKVLFNNLVVGLLPVLVVFLIMSLITMIQTAKNGENLLISSLERMRELIDNEKERLLNFSYFYSINVPDKTYRGIRNLNYLFNNSSSLLHIENYNIPILEFTLSNEVVKSVWSYSDDNTAQYVTGKESVDLIWNKLSSPFFTHNTRIDFPDITNGILVIRAVSLLYNYATSEKMGVAIISIPLNSVFLKKVLKKQEDLIVYIETKDKIVTTSDEFNQSPELNKIKKLSFNNLVFTENKAYHLMDFGKNGKYYVYRKNLYKKGKDDIAYLGILYNYNSINQSGNTLLAASLILFIVSSFLVFGLTLYLSGILINPILNLKGIVENFKSGEVIIPPPKVIDDEVSILQDSFSKMSSDIYNKTEALKFTNTELVEKNRMWKETLIELKEAQDQIIVHEKMSSLGQLIAGIAHEINTPLGVIRASADNSREGIKAALDNLLILYRKLSTNKLDIFLEMFHTADQMSNKEKLNSSEERLNKKVLRKYLESNEVTDSDIIADELVKIGFQVLS